MAIFDVPQRFSQKWVYDKVPTMDLTEFHAMFHEAATRGWDEDELRQLDGMWPGRAARLDRCRLMTEPIRVGPMTVKAS